MPPDDEHNSTHDSPIMLNFDIVKHSIAIHAAKREFPGQKLLQPQFDIGYGSASYTLLESCPLLKMELRGCVINNCGIVSCKLVDCIIQNSLILKSSTISRSTVASCTITDSTLECSHVVESTIKLCALSRTTTKFCQTVYPLALRTFAPEIRALIFDLCMLASEYRPAPDGGSDQVYPIVLEALIGDQGLYHEALASLMKLNMVEMSFGQNPWVNIKLVKFIIPTYTNRGITLINFMDPYVLYVNPTKVRFDSALQADLMSRIVNLKLAPVYPAEFRELMRYCKNLKRLEFHWQAKHRTGEYIYGSLNFLPKLATLTVHWDLRFCPRPTELSTFREMNDLFVEENVGKSGDFSFTWSARAGRRLELKTPEDMNTGAFLRYNTRLLSGCRSAKLSK